MKFHEYPITGVHVLIKSVGVMRQCHACEFETFCNAYPPPFIGRRAGARDNWFCSICATTMISNAVQYPSQYPDIVTLKTIGYTTNLILQRIEALERKLLYGR